MAFTREQERAYWKGWAETGKWLEEIKWRELAEIDDARAFEASRDLLNIGLSSPLPEHRRRWSGLIDFQDLLHGRKPARKP